MSDLEQRVRDSLRKTPPEWTDTSVLTQHVCQGLPDEYRLHNGDIRNVLNRMVDSSEVEVKDGENTGMALYRLTAE